MMGEDGIDVHQDGIFFGFRVRVEKDLVGFHLGEIEIIFVKAHFIVGFFEQAGMHLGLALASHKLGIKIFVVFIHFFDLDGVRVAFF